VALNLIVGLGAMADAAAERAANRIVAGANLVIRTLNAAFEFQDSLLTVKQDAKFSGATTMGAATLASAIITGSAAVAGGVTQGSRVCAVRGFVGQSSLGTDGAYIVAQYAPGATPGFTNDTHVATQPGSIAAISCRAYGATGSAGTLQFVSNGALVNVSTAAIGFAAINSRYFATFAPGAFPYVAGQPLNVTVTSAGWVQATGTTGIQVALWVYE